MIHFKKKLKEFIQYEFEYIIQKLQILNFNLIFQKTFCLNQDLFLNKHNYNFI
jgi:hypothetical protein